MEHGLTSIMPFRVELSLPARAETKTKVFSGLTRTQTPPAGEVARSPAQSLLRFIGCQPCPIRPTNPQIFQLARVLVDRGANALLITRQRAGHQAGLVVAAGQSPRGNIPGRLLRGPFHHHRLYRRLRPAFFGPLAAMFLAVFFAAFHWPLGARELPFAGREHHPGSRAGTHGGPAARRVLWWATLGRARTRPEHKVEPGDRPDCSQPAGRIVAGQSSGVRAEVAGRAAQVASVRSVARRER
jgi:hypothetical protein